MEGHEARRLVGTLFAAYSMSPPEETVTVYARSILDFTSAEAQRAVNVLVATEVRLPTVAKLRDVVFEERLGIPFEHEAWELVQRILRHDSRPRTCQTCGGRCLLPTDDGADLPCVECRGSGEVATIRAPEPDEVTRRALDYVGGLRAVRTTDRPEVLRAQFGRAFLAFRQARLREANLVGLGVLQPAAEQLALGRAREEAA